MTKFRDGDVSYHVAAKVLRVKYATIAALVKAKKLRGGEYPRNERGRYVTWDSVVRLHRAKLDDQIRTYETVREHLKEYAK